MSSESITLHVRLGTTARFTIPSSSGSGTITTNSTIQDVKSLISREVASGFCAVERQRLIYKGRILSDNSRTLSDYGVAGDNQTIHLVKGSAGVSTTPAPSTSNVQQPTASTPIAGSNPNGASNSNPMMMMRNMMQQQQGGGMPDMNAIQQQLLQNPEMMSSMMNSPMMQNIMSNPDMIRMMMDSNPEMRRVLDSNPQLRHIMDDPELMRRSMDMMRDPSAMQNMMRNQDLAMSQIENVPGGFNALRRMYEEVQEPMMDAMAGGAGTDVPEIQSTSSQTGTAMPNPWGAPRDNPTPSSTPSQNANPFASMNAWGGAGQNARMPGSTAAPNPFSMPNLNQQGSGGVPGMNIEQTISMLENPLVNTMMQQMMSDPQTMQTMLNNNPLLQQMRQSNPATAAMMSNPETLRAMMDPANLRSMLQMQNSFQQLGNNVPGFQSMMPGESVPGSNPSAQPNLDFSSLLNQFQNTSVSTSVPSQQRPPAERFNQQLTALNDMGFCDRDANIQALSATHGNINRAVERLLSSTDTGGSLNSTTESS